MQEKLEIFFPSERCLFSQFSQSETFLAHKNLEKLATNTGKNPFENDINLNNYSNRLLFNICFHTPFTNESVRAVKKNKVGRKW